MVAFSASTQPSAQDHGGQGTLYPTSPAIGYNPRAGTLPFLTISMANIVVCALYQFAVLDDPARLRAGLLAVLGANGVRGTLLVAREGVNGTICGSRDGVDAVLGWLGRQPGLDGIQASESYIDAAPFKRTRVKLKKEIVTLGVADLDPTRCGVHVDPQAWNALLEDDVLVVDVRNEYEVKIGAFAGALNPHTTNFREFPAFADRHLAPYKHQKIAMYCTGGIRCEKSTAYLRQQGFEQVFHLKGGILKYLEAVPEAESRWRGACFVFDERVAVDHRLQKGAYDQCHACRSPISEADKASDQYIPGAACPHCHDRVSAAARAGFVERQKQVQLAAGRGTEHLGPRAMAGRNEKPPVGDGLAGGAGATSGTSGTSQLHRRQNQRNPA